MSLSRNGRSTLESVISRRAAQGMFQEEPRPSWNDETEEQYLERVRERAQSQAKEIIAQSQAQAERIREQAYQEGLRQGREEAAAELAEERQRLEARFQELMAASEREKAVIWDRHRAAILELIRFAVEKVVRVELEERKGEILGSLMDESLDLLESGKEVAVHVHPEDEAIMQEVLDRLQEGERLRGSWTVRPSSSLDPGSLVLETSDGRIDNSIETRFEAIREVLEQIAVNGNGDGGGGLK